MPPIEKPIRLPTAKRRSLAGLVKARKFISSFFLFSYSPASRIQVYAFTAEKKKKIFSKKKRNNNNELGTSIITSREARVEFEKD